MTDPAITAKQLVDLAIKNIEDQQCRIVRQRKLMANYERDDDVARLSGARLVLERMEKQPAQMTAVHVAAEERLAKLSVDEASVKIRDRFRNGGTRPGLRSCRRQWWTSSRLKLIVAVITAPFRRRWSGCPRNGWQLGDRPQRQPCRR